MAAGVLWVARTIARRWREVGAGREGALPV